MQGDPLPLKCNTKGAPVMVAKADKRSNIDHHWS